jgi:phytoene dehydrogenase-like protein
METYDAIIIGSGHNALVTAAYLVRAGWSVLVLEKNDRPGGLVRTEALTLPGFQHDVFSSSHPLFLAGPAYAELGAELTERGLHYVGPELPTGVSLADGRTAVLSTDMAANIAEAERLAPGDGAAWAAMVEEFSHYAPAVFGLFSMDLTAPQAMGLLQQLLTTPDGGWSPVASDFLLPARDWLTTHFRSEVMQGMLAPWGLHMGRGPDEANSGIWVQLAAVAIQLLGAATPVGGSEMLARTLAQLIKDKGGVIRTDTLVSRILVSDGQATGVQTSAREQYAAKRAVIASTNPDQLYLTLLDDAPTVPPALRQQAAKYRYGRGAMQIHLALSEPPHWADARLDRAGQFHLTTGLDGVSKAVNEAVRGMLPAEPTISFDAPSVIDPSRAPTGQAVVRIQLLETPYRPRGDAGGTIDVGDGTWTDDLKNRYADRILEIIGRHVPNVPAALLARAILSPQDIEAFSPNLRYGDPSGGVHDLAQSYLFRPLPSQPSHRTAIANVYMVGAATWPGQGISGGSGYIVAQQLLQEG